jgi:hypothetical protein
MRLALKHPNDVGVSIRPGSGWVRLVRSAPLRIWRSGTPIGTRINWAGPPSDLMNKRTRFPHDNDAFGLVDRTLYGKQMLDYSGGDTDTSSYIPGIWPVFPIICLNRTVKSQRQSWTAPRFLRTRQRQEADHGAPDVGKKDCRDHLDRVEEGGTFERRDKAA